MNGKKARQIRKAAAYKRGAEYEPPKIHHLATMPTFEMHERVIREMGPAVRGELPNTKATCYFLHPWGDSSRRLRVISGARAYVVSHTVTKPLFTTDGKRALRPALQLAKHADGTMHHEPQTALFPVSAPARLKEGTPKRIYRLLKRLERTIGLDRVYAQLVSEAAV